MILSQKIISEFLGTAGLLIVVVGSGIMGETLSPGNPAIALLANSLATGAGLYALIQTFSHFSGAHFNPVVSLIEFLRKQISSKDLIWHVLSQILGAICGVFITHLMFGQSLFQLSTHDRSDFRFFISEIIATFGLIIVILLSSIRNNESTPSSVSLYIISAYWCTSSTSFANPAVTLARSLTNTFSGIVWTSTPAFIFAQIVGAALAFLFSRFLLKQNT